MNDLPILESSFVKRLAAQLRENGEEVVQEFKLKSGVHADLYLPSMPRGLVEVKLRSQAPARAVLAQLEKFGSDMPDAHLYLVVSSAETALLEDVMGRERVSVIPADLRGGEHDAVAATTDRLLSLDMSTATAGI